MAVLLFGIEGSITRRNGGALPRGILAERLAEDFPERAPLLGGGPLRLPILVKLAQLGRGEFYLPAFGAGKMGHAAHDRRVLAPIHRESFRG